MEAWDLFQLPDSQKQIFITHLTIKSLKQFVLQLDSLERYFT